MVKSFRGSCYFYFVIVFVFIGISFLFRHLQINENTSAFIAIIFSTTVYLLSGIFASRDFSSTENHEKFLILYFVITAIGECDYGIVHHLLNDPFPGTAYILVHQVPYSVAIACLAFFSFANSFLDTSRQDKTKLIPIYCFAFVLIAGISFKLILIHQFDPGYHRPWYIRFFSWNYGICQALAGAGLVVSTIRTVNLQRIVVYIFLVAQIGVDLVLRYQDISKVSHDTVFFTYLYSAFTTVIMTTFYLNSLEPEDRQPLNEFKPMVSMASLGLLSFMAIPIFMIPTITDQFGVFFGAAYTVLLCIVWGAINLFSLLAIEARKKVVDLIAAGKNQLDQSQINVAKFFGLSPLENSLEKLRSNEDFYHESYQKVKSDLLRIRLLDGFIHDSEVPLSTIQTVLWSLPDSEKYLALAKKSVFKLRSMIAALDRGKAAGGEKKILGDRTLIVDLFDDVINEISLYFHKLGKTRVEFQIEAKTATNTMWVEGSYEKLSQSFVNIIKNAGEAISDVGLVKIELNQSSKSIVITIADNGCGMTATDVKNYGKVLFSRKNSKGIGTIEATSFIESFGGTIQVYSHEEIGTTLLVTLPKREAPSWFANEILIENTVVLLDDDDQVFDLWELRFGRLENTTRLFKCKTIGEFDSTVTNLLNDKIPFTALVDYRLGHIENVSGIDIIRRIQENCNTYLVTSNWHEVYTECSDKNIKILPKKLIQYIPIKEVTNNKVNQRRIVLIDDNSILHESWEFAAREIEVFFVSVKTKSEYENYKRRMRNTDTIFVDKNLGWGDGLQLSKELGLLGMNSIYITTGGVNNRNLVKESAGTAVLDVVSKDFPSHLFEKKSLEVRPSN